jgi:MFS family permease
MSQDSAREGAATARVAAAVIFFLSGLNVATWVSRIPAIKDQLRIGEAELGIALFCSAIGSMLLMPLWGAWTARWGSRPASRLAAVTAFAAVPLLAFAPTLPWLMAALAIFGATAGGLNVAMNAQAVAVQAAYGRPILSSFHACFSLGGMTGAAFGGWLVALGAGVAAHFIGSAITYVGAALIASRFLLPSSVDRHEQQARFVFPHGALLALGLLAGCVMSGEGAMADWVALYLRDTVRTSEGTAALGYAVFSGGMVTGRVLGDWATARWGGRTLAQVCCAIAALGTTLALALPFTFPVLLGFALTGLGYSVIVPLVYAAAGRLPGTNPGVAIATVSVTGFVGFLAGPPVIGFLAKAITLRGALAVLVLLSAAGLWFARAIKK